MFRKLLRDLFEHVPQTRVGFITEPTAMIASNDHRPLHRVNLDGWAEVTKRHAGAAMSAAVIGANEDPHGYALVLIDGSEDLVVVELPSRKDRAAFLVEYLEHESSSRSLSRFDAVALRLNPPPPPPPPGYPPPEWMTRLEAGLRVLRLPVLVSKVEVNVGLENATRGGMR